MDLTVVACSTLILKSDFSFPIGWLYIGAIDRFPSSRTGYTFSCWMKVNYFLTDEAGLFGWQDTTKHSIFEVYFKTFTDVGMYQQFPSHFYFALRILIICIYFIDKTQSQKVTKKLKRCLCVQTQSHPSPPEFYVFDRIAFMECGGWHHILLLLFLPSRVYLISVDIAFTHIKQQVTFFVDGKLVQTSTLNYPRAKELEGCVARRLTVNPIGNRNAGVLPNLGNMENAAGRDNAYFCGQLGTMYFMEGAWDISLISYSF